MSINYSDYYRQYLAGNYTAEDFYYGPKGNTRPRGPWPQPSPDHPFGQFAEVLSIPDEERKDWNRYVARKYVWLLLTRWPMALWYCLTNPHLKPLSDERFTYFLSETLYSRYLMHIPQEHLSSYEDFFPGLLNQGGEYYKADFRIMDRIAAHTYPGMYAAPSAVLFHRDPDAKTIKPVGIYLHEQKICVTPQDIDAWTLAKYFVMQGASHRVNLVTHAVLHFPFDPINAITKTLLPKTHLLFKLLFPHLYLELPVNNAVLEGPASLINRTTWTIYSPFVAKGQYIRQLLPVGYTGVPSEHEPQSFVPYEFPLVPEFIDPDTREIKPEYAWLAFFQFHFAYYKTIHSFVKQIIDKLLAAPLGNPDLYYVQLWAEQISQWVPGFPGGEQITQPGVLTDAVASIIWDLAVAHPTDHEQIHRIRPDELVFRLRVPPPPTKDWKGFDQNKLNKRRDFFKSWLTDKLFYEPHNVTWLKDVDYRFEDEHLQGLNAQFLHELRAVEQDLTNREVTLFAKLDDLACSIQY